jgi:menaquinone-dependent protoporphyrinogen IX oxidase
MLRTVVVYRSLSGFTKKYATWIAEDLKADLYDARKIQPEKIAEYDSIVFGGSLHAVGINGIKLIKSNLQKLAAKKIIIFAVGASPLRENVLDEIKNKNFTRDEQRNIAFYYLRGGFDYGKLNRSNKVLMKLLKAKLSLKRSRTPDEIGMLAAYSKPVDFTKRANIGQIVKYARSLAQGA